MANRSFTLVLAHSGLAALNRRGLTFRGVRPVTKNSTIGLGMLAQVDLGVTISCFGGFMFFLLAIQFRRSPSMTITPGSGYLELRSVHWEQGNFGAQIKTVKVVIWM